MAMADMAMADKAMADTAMADTAMADMGMKKRPIGTILMPGRKMNKNEEENG